MIAKLGGLAERLVDDRVECDDAANELAPHRLGFFKSGSGDRQGAGEAAGDLGRNGGEQGGQAAPRAAEIGSGENDAGADDADADLADAVDGEQEGLTVRAAGRTELVARDDRRRIAGERRRIGREVAQKAWRRERTRPPTAPAL